MPTRVAVTPTYASGDLGQILAIEERQVEDSIADLTEEQMAWRPNAKAKSALEILWHLAYEGEQARPANKAAALAALRAYCAEIQDLIATPGKVDEPFTWWTGDVISFRGVVWGRIRHLSYHLGEIVYLRQVMGLDEPKYYHEE